MKTENKINREDVTTLSDIIKTHLNIDVSEKTRRREVIDARMIFYKILREMGNTLVSIGSIHNKDHSTIIHSIQTCENLMYVDKNLKERYNLVREMFYSYKGDGIMKMKSRNDLIKKVIESEKENDILRRDIAILREKVFTLDRYKTIYKQLSDNNITDEELETVSRRIAHILNNRHS